MKILLVLIAISLILISGCQTETGDDSLEGGIDGDLDFGEPQDLNISDLDDLNLDDFDEELII